MKENKFQHIEPITLEIKKYLMLFKHQLSDIVYVFSFINQFSDFFRFSVSTALPFNSQRPLFSKPPCFY